MLRDLLNELVKLLSVHSKQDPLRVGIVAIELRDRFVTVILVVTVPLVIWIDVLSKQEQA